MLKFCLAEDSYAFTLACLSSILSCEPLEQRNSLLLGNLETEKFFDHGLIRVQISF